MNRGNNKAAGRDKDSQYYTPQEECVKLLDIVNKHWGPLQPGTRVLEPAAGCGNLPLASKEYYPDLEWVTNELFPDGSNFRPDFVEDFMGLTPSKLGPFDFVITNPPYSGKAGHGDRTYDLATAFIRHSFEFADRLAMVLPSTYLRPKHISFLPEGCKIVGHTDPEVIRFHTGGKGGGEEHRVRTSFILYERTGEPGLRLLEGEVEGFRFARGYDEATHAICNWGHAGACRSIRDQLWTRDNWAGEVPVVVDSYEIEEWLMGGGLQQCIQDYSWSNSNSLQDEEITHYLNLRFNG